MAEKHPVVSRVRVGLDPAWEKLAALQELTRKTGILSEAQVVQLKLWPLAFTNATTSTCEFSFENRHLIFRLGKLKGKKPKNFKARLEFLVSATQRLLGGEYSVTVMVDGRKALYGKPTSDS